MHVYRKRGTSDQELPEQTPLESALGGFKKQSRIVFRYMDTAMDPWPEDYLAMEPEEDVSRASEEAMQVLRKREKEGHLRQIEYVYQDMGGRTIAMVALDVQGAGFVCGLGLADDRTTAQQLAARQALDRLVIPEDYIAYIRECAESVRGHDYDDGARVPALQGAEALEVLKNRVRYTRVCSFCPCGSAWMSAVSTRVFNQTHVFASSAHWLEETAMALCSEVFISRLRWFLRVPRNDPHNPAEWGRTWAQRAAAKEPWGGVDRVAVSNTLVVEPLQSEREQELLEMLGEDKGRYERNTALQTAIRLRSSLDEKEQEEEAWQPELRPDGKPWDDEKERAQKAKKAPVEPRPFEVASLDEDPRRPEIVGKLPVEGIRRDLSATLEFNQVVVVSGGTGSGKTTQLPQFLLDDFQGEGITPQRIVVTQPRRIAAISVAERVAWERMDTLGQGVGYSVKGNSTYPRSREGSIEFVTVGTLLRRAIGTPLLDDISVIVVDEVHERDMLTDFLLILLREVLEKRPSLRLVLMSATLDTNSFASYFQHCPVLEVPSGTLYPVEEFHLNDEYFNTFEEREYLVQTEQEDHAAVSYGSETGVTLSVPWGGDKFADSHMLDLMTATIRREVPQLRAVDDRLSILCFLPGWAEIQKVIDLLNMGPGAKDMWLLPLHSTIPKHEQRRIFDPAPPGRVKVILGTNVAESSVTIDDVAVVIDSGLQRELSYDAERRMSTLGTVRVSKSNAVQRKGRTGRVREGKVLRLYTDQHLEKAPIRPAPEMQRCDLAQACLQAAALDRDPRSFLASALDPPLEDAVEVAMEELMAVDALEEGTPPRLLPVGEIIARLPLEPQFGRAAMYGCLLGLPQQTATLLAVCGGGQSAFQAEGGRRVHRDQIKVFAEWSDTLASARALLDYEEQVRNEGEGSAEQWCRSYNLSALRLAQFSRDKKQLLKDMERVHLLVASANAVQGDDDDANLAEDREEMEGEMDRMMDLEDPSAKIDYEHESLLQTVLCMAYPTHFARRPRMGSPQCKAMSLMAYISPSSVNGQHKKEGCGPQQDSDEPPTWWVYAEMQKSEGKAHGFLQGTTRVQDWQVPLFCGLHIKDIGVGEKNDSIELDGWVNAKGDSNAATGLFRSLRREVQDALSWQALVALQNRHENGPAERYLRRGSVLVRGALSALSGKELEGADEVKAWEAPSAEELEAAFRHPGRTPRSSQTKPAAAAKAPAMSAAPASKPTNGQRGRTFSSSAAAPAPAAASNGTGDSNGTGEKELRAKTVAQLKEILKGMGLKVGGKKAELVDRILEGQLA